MSMWLFKKNKELTVIAQEPNEYVKRIEQLTFEHKICWVVTDGIREISAEDKENNLLLRLVLKNSVPYLLVSDSDIFRVKEYNEVYNVSNMGFPIHLYITLFSIHTH